MHTSDMFEIPEFIATSLVKKLIQVIFYWILKSIQKCIANPQKLPANNFLNLAVFFELAQVLCLFLELTGHMPN